MGSLFGMEACVAPCKKCMGNACINSWEDLFISCEIGNNVCFVGERRW